MKKITFIGGGNMGYALMAGVMSGNLPYELTASDPDLNQRTRCDSLGVTTTENNLEAIKDADVVVLAVKPQIMPIVAEEIAPHYLGQLTVSIAAGTPLTKLEEWFGRTTPIIRCMPNTPALIGEGITGLIANDQVQTEHRDLVQQLITVCGKVVWFKSDDDLDKVTALSGSGPSYFFYLIEALIHAGEALGLSREDAQLLATQTALGSAKMAIEPGSDPGELRRNVTSPGGTTEAALNSLAKENVSESFIVAVKAAYDRAQELAK